jgi:hypothetical protein
MQLYQLKFPNGKSYIGITTKTTIQRFKEHCAPSNNKNACQNAIHKHGKENVIISVLAECDNFELLLLAEKEAIEKFNTFIPNGYNLTLGGEGRITVNVFGEERIKREKTRIASNGKKRYSEKSDQIKNQAKNYYLANKEKQQAGNKRYHIENKESIVKQRSAYYYSNQSRLLEEKKQYRLNNLEKFKTKDLKYYHGKKNANS